MTKHLILSILISLILSDTRTQYEYLQMVQQWPEAICSGVGVKCNVVPPNMFTIHGLWPTNYTNNPLVCTPTPFLTHEVKRIKELDTYWTDLIWGNNFGFWKHEWLNHGICSTPPFTQFRYFLKTLNMRRKLDLLTLLNEEGVAPTPNIIRFRYSDIADAIERITEYTPALRCNHNARNPKLMQLSEIILCYDYYGITQIDCPSTAGGNCPSTGSLNTNRFVSLAETPLSMRPLLPSF